MNANHEEIHVDRTEARAGSTPGIVRYVLAISLVLVVIAFAIIFMTGAFTADHSTNAQDSSARAVAEQKSTQP